MELKTLIVRRGVIRTKVTKTETNFGQLIKDGQLKKLSVCRDKLLVCQKDLEELDAEIVLQYSDDDALQSEIETSEGYRDTVIDLLSSLNFEIQKLCEINQSVDDSASNLSNNTSKRAKLPQLKIAPFSGNPLKWQEFWDSFESMIHSDASLTPVIKFNYLCTFLENEAKRTIEGLTVTNVNYNVAIDMLKERYGNEEVIIFAHLDKLFSMPKATDETKKLRNTVDECEKHIRSLEAFGSLTTDQVFTPLILSKLPQELRISLHRKNGKNPWKLATLRENLKEELIARELGERHFGENNTEELTKHVHIQKNKPRSTTESMIAHSDLNRYSCVFCQENHYSDECKKYSEANERKSKLDGRCFSCLMKGHSASRCRKAKQCYHCNKKGHHRSLCYLKFGSKKNDTHNIEEKAPTNVLEVSVSNVKEKTISNNDEMVPKNVLTQTAMANIMNPISSGISTIRVRLILDTGANRSFISQRLAKLLHLKNKSFENLSIATFGAYSKREMKCPIVEIFIEDIDGTRKSTHVSVVPKISCSNKRTYINISMYPALQNLILADPWQEEEDDQEIELLIGSDFYYDFVKEKRINLAHGLVALDTAFGWVPTGRISQSETFNEAHTLLALDCQLENSDVKFCLERFWSLESVGIKESASINDDDLALQRFNDTITFKKGRYEVTWPWKVSDPELPENYHLAFGRLKSLSKRLEKTPEVMEKYNEIINDQLKNGIIEKITEETEEFERKHYIPHHCVLKPNKTTTKVRIVYDASAKPRKDANSLNECLFRGPVIMEDLTGIVMRFRMNSIAISCDIEKAFLQVGLQMPDRDVVRFLWLKNSEFPFSNENVEKYRFCRIPFGVISSPFLLGATVAHHLKQSCSELTNDVQRNIYVDNVLIGRSSVEQSEQLYKELKSIMNAASMNLREWYSNSEEFLSRIPIEDKSNDQDIVSVLGLQWNIKTDTIEIKGPNLLEMNLIPTKRQILKKISEVFDPLGLCAPATITSKMFMQVLWKYQLDWDDPVPQPLIDNWIEIKSELMKISKLKIPRFISEDNDKNAIFDLHCFVDASGKAYAASVYLVIKCPNKVISNLVFCKARLAPVKSISIPRLELMAVLIGVRIMNFVEQNLDLKISTQIIWSDAKCVLYWIHNQRVKPVFIENRLKEIRKYKQFQFRYVPTTMNPADFPTRGLHVEEMIDSSIWWHGPDFLLLHEKAWPEEWIPCEVVDGSDENNVSEVNIIDVKEEKLTPFGIDVNKFSTLQRLQRVTAWAARFVKRLKIKNCKVEKTLTSREIEEAIVMWEKSIQQEFFQEELKSITEEKNHKLVRQLGLFIDEDIIRCSGRFANADLFYEERYPKLLPKKSYFTKLVIENYHCKVLHAGSRQTLSKIRTNYWIPQGRSTVQNVLKDCLVCRRHQGAAYSVPPTAPLPLERLSEGFPFACTGIDHMGPLYIKEDNEVRKVYICLFTCAVVRAVHLEVVRRLSTEEFLLALRRFVSKRGKPQLIISDNARSFKLAKKTLISSWNNVLVEPDIQNYAADKNIEWKFITEYSPWMGGFYERMVGSVKRSLRKVVGKTCLDIVQLQTIVMEIEAVINSRPLTYVEADINDHKLLTPSHFLNGSPKTGFPNIIKENDKDYKIREETHDILIKNWLHGQNILNNYWSCWRTDYLQQLRETSQFVFKATRIPEEDHVVLIGEKIPRGQWKHGRITKLIPSRDGVVRTAEIILPNRKLIQRPIRNLYPIENYCNKIQDLKCQTGTNVKEESSAITVKHRPMRKSAAEAKLSIGKIYRRECHDDS